MTRLCVPLVEKSTDALLAAMRALPTEVDLVEVRVDAMADCDLDRICRAKDRPIIVTNRPVRQGGACNAPEEERLAVLRRAAELGADYVDVELDSAAALGPLPSSTARIISHHDLEGTPADLEGLLRRIRQAGADVAKLAVTARDVCDVPAVIALLQRHAAEGPLIALAMGDEGVSSRILAGKFGAFLTYASRAAGAGSAPGQVPYDQMLGLYRFPQIGPATAVYGVVANPVAHSMSPAIHNTAFAALGLDAVYLPFRVTDCAGFLAGFGPFDLKGLSVTIPHKETMLGLMDEVDELGRSIGAVNTVKITDGHRYGCNTDLAACVAAVEDAARRAGLRMERCRALIVGGGGAARAFAHGLRARVAGLTIANRTVERGVRIAGEVGAASCGLDEMTELRPDIIVNATSVGMWPQVDATPVPASMLRAGMAVVESVYNPVQTRLLREAEAVGATTATGLGWFVDQAAAQCELWTGREAPREVMEQVVRSRLEGA